MEVTNVSLEIRVNRKWKTIIRYDNAHGKLHRHTYFSPEHDTDIVDYVGVRQKGSQKRLLGWAIDNIKQSYIIYKRTFIKRCKSLGYRLDIELY